MTLVLSPSATQRRLPVRWPIHADPAHHLKCHRADVRISTARGARVLFKPDCPVYAMTIRQPRIYSRPVHTGIWRHRHPTFEIYGHRTSRHSSIFARQRTISSTHFSQVFFSSSPENQPAPAPADVRSPIARAYSRLASPNPQRRIGANGAPRQGTTTGSRFTHLGKQVTWSARRWDLLTSPSKDAHTQHAWD